MSRTTQSIVGGLLKIAFVGSLLTSAFGQKLEVKEPQILQLVGAPEKYAGQKVVVSGRLESVDSRYFTSSRFVLLDPAGVAIPVSAWAPLEVPPSMSNIDMATGEIPRTMRDYAGRNVSINGTFTLGADNRFELVTESADDLGAGDRGADFIPAPITADITPDAAAAIESGTRTRVLVLMVDFPDQPGQVSREFFQELLFGNWPGVAPAGSFKDYFREISYGKLDITGEVNAPGIQWLRLPQPLSYYSGNCYGIGRGTECATPRYPQNPQKMVEDAITAARTAGINFAQYDANNDGRIDSLFVIHSGRGSDRSFRSSDIWSHRWFTPSRIDTGSKNASGNAIYAQYYLTEPEYWDRPGDMTIGGFAHEYGHDLGLPDLYDPGMDSAGIGDWSLMSTGCWNGVLGDTPAHPDPWSKSVVGWVNPKKVGGALIAEPIEEAATSPDVYQLLDGSPGSRSGEYFLVENRRRMGFDAGLPASGLLIWHVDDGIKDNGNQWYPGCANCVGHYRVTLIQADRRWDLEKNANRGDSGDPFSESDLDTFLYRGGPGGVSVTAISAPGHTMTATLSTGAMTVPTVRSVPFRVEGLGGVSIAAEGTSSAPVTGYARIQADPGSVSAAGLVFIESRENNTLTSETSLAASPAVQSGRISVSVGEARNTGIGLANPNSEVAVISFFFTDTNGRDFGHGSFQLAPHTQMTRFFSEAPFNVGAFAEGTYTFSSSLPVGVAALRTLVNERSQFLTTTLPIASLEATTGAVILPHYADGGGWSTQVLLVNPTDRVLNGTAQFFVSGDSANSSVFTYSIAPRSQQTLQTSGTGDRVRIGSLHVVPSSENTAPSVSAILSLRTDGVTVARAGVSATPLGRAFRLYAQFRGDFLRGEAGSIETGVAIANPSSISETVYFELTRLDGTSVGPMATAVVPGQGQLSVFLRQIPEFASLSAPVEGILRISTSSSSGLAVVGFRSRYNERREFLITAIPPIDENDPPMPGDRILPLIVNGGGFSTHTLLLSPSTQPASGRVVF